jgi:hypothetical protein
MLAEQAAVWAVDAAGVVQLAVAGLRDGAAHQYHTVLLCNLPPIYALSNMNKPIAHAVQSNIT